MHKIPGFEILEKIKEGSTAVIYRARKNDATYILKVMATEYPSQYELARFLNEYETLRQIQSDVIIRAEEILENENSIILVLEDFQGRSLKEVYAHRSIEISEFLKVAISISLALEAIHSRGISHRDLKPQNILINPNTGQLKVTDFGLSSLQAPETDNGHKSGILEGTLPYISPEQTGRMNREADYRTDFYSLGVTLYELLTGLLPFPAEDPLEIIHSHLAIVPPNPRSIRADVFPVLSKILMKLLAKIPDQRYQSAVGLRADLERCLAEFEAGGSVPDFAVGMHEANTFRIPQRLYGREEELQDLLHAFHRASEGARELVVVNGPSGIGKTALVSELREPLSRKDGYFLWGKFEELKRDIPYSAIIVAFRGLIRSLLSESHDRLSRWRKSIQTALDQNGQLIVNVIPELELILGKQPPIPEVSPAEAQNRFSYTIQEFVRVFADETHPLAIFLDDIQWADRASLNLLEWITLNPDLTHFLAIVSYRDKSVSPFVLECLDSIVSRGGTIREIALKPLEQSALRELLSETFSRDDAMVQSLALQLVKRTGGNPFFVREFLRTLQERSLIYIQNEWKWDMDLIERSGITENVAELLTGRIDHLPDPTIESLTLGATIGNRFSLDELSEVQEIPARQIFANLKPALDEGFLTVDGSTLVFVHDRVREAAYELLSPADRDRLHYRIGATRLANLTEATDDETIFGIVNQLGAGKSCILDSGERAQLVALALRAAQAARSAAAFRSAVDYLNLAVEFLPEDPWNTNYHQTLMVYTDLAESQYSSTNFEEAQRLFALVLSRARTVLDKVRIFQMQVESLVPQNRLAEAIESARSSLKQLGLAIPARAGKFTALPGLLWVKRKIGKNIEELAQLPEMTDPQDLAKMHLLMQTIAPAFIANPNLFPVLLLKMVNMTLQKGLCPE
ncbi:MAG: serine/threonine-protein kinase PknK, partial [Leptospiraceae bacterium]|nr:serine/threonine-protein kinase PknK [Leptospiraceae bacterium]